MSSQQLPGSLGPSAGGHGAGVRLRLSQFPALTFHNLTDGAMAQEGRKRPQEVVTPWGWGPGRAGSAEPGARRTPHRALAGRGRAGPGWWRPGPWGSCYSCIWPQVSRGLLTPSCQAWESRGWGRGGVGRGHVPGVSSEPTLTATSPPLTSGSVYCPDKLGSALVLGPRAFPTAPWRWGPWSACSPTPTPQAAALTVLALGHGVKGWDKPFSCL